MLPSPWPMRIGSLLLREAVETDVEVMLRVRNDPSVNCFMIHTHVEAGAFREELLAPSVSESDFSCVVELDGRTVAMGRLSREDGMGQPGMPRRTQGDIGYIVDPAFAGRGIASGVARGLLTAAFERLGLRRVTAGCSGDNPASARVLDKVGMRCEQHGVADFWHAQLGWVDGYRYAILAGEWRAANPPAAPAF